MRMFKYVLISGYAIIAILVLSVYALGYRKQYQSELETSARNEASNIHNIINRDARLAGAMQSFWDRAPAIETTDDTLIFRFSELDSVRYYINDVGHLYRQNALISFQVTRFEIIRPNLDPNLIQIFITIRAQTRYGQLASLHRTFRWNIRPRIEEDIGE